MTTRTTVAAAPPGAGGYRRLVTGPGERHVVRTDLAPASSATGEVLLAIAHLSDIHVCDAQSPARIEFLDRWADPDSPILDIVGEVGTYRAQEILTAQVADSIVRAVNAVEAAPVSGAPLQLAISTGDNTDNAQANELAWYLALLDGGPVHPDSGDASRYEGVADDVVFDSRFWHPESVTGDRPRDAFGLPTVPGLLDAVRRPFAAAGLRLPWLAVHGNHDQMLQGTVPAAGWLAAAAVSGYKPIDLPEPLAPEALLALLGGLNECDPAALADLARARMRTVTADPARRIVSRDEFVAAHFSPAARPAGHGFGADRRPYYRYDHGPMSLLVLDTVNEFGGWQGSLDLTQLDWLRSELASADSERRYVVLASHHRLDDMVNGRPGPGGGHRILGPEMADLLAGHPSVVLWLNGHSHQTAVTPHGTWWELTAPSLIDWPQQARLVEILRGDGVLTIAATMLDHDGELPWTGAVDSPAALAGLSRELAANDWQWRTQPLERHPRAGTAHDRNVLLPIRDPWA